MILRLDVISIKKLKNPISKNTDTNLDKVNNPVKQKYHAPCYCFDMKKSFFIDLIDF